MNYQPRQNRFSTQIDKRKCLTFDNTSPTPADASSLNAPVKHPLHVSNPDIRTQLQLAGLRFLCSRARWLEHEAKLIGIALKSGEITSDEADDRLAELGVLDLVYPDLMGEREC